MPYIKNERRDEVRAFSLKQAETPGELNFQLTSLALTYLSTHGKSYTTLNEIVGALECAKIEFYRRIIGPYEHEKRAKNGDVY